MDLIQNYNNIITYTRNESFVLDDGTQRPIKPRPRRPDSLLLSDTDLRDGTSTFGSKGNVSFAFCAMALLLFFFVFFVSLIL